MEWLRWSSEVLLAHQETLLKLSLAALLGALIGLEREVSGKPAGFRTNLLICLGAALLTDLSIFVALVPGSATEFRSDPARIAAQIVSGMGFLGAGTIIKSGGAVTGLTTAVTVWVVAAIGMAVGAGAYGAALLAFGLVMLALFILRRLEDRLLRRHRAERTVEVRLAAADGALPRIEQQILASELELLAISVAPGEAGFTASYQTRGAAERYPHLLQALLAEAGVQRVSLH
jgi:putative Mg2+ transporter-C (MgtC) family protein